MRAARRGAAGPGGSGRRCARRRCETRVRASSSFRHWIGSPTISRRSVRSTSRPVSVVATRRFGHGRHKAPKGSATRLAIPALAGRLAAVALSTEGGGALMPALWGGGSVGAPPMPDGRSSSRHDRPAGVSSRSLVGGASRPWRDGLEGRGSGVRQGLRRGALLGLRRRQRPVVADGSPEKLPPFIPVRSRALPVRVALRRRAAQAVTLISRPQVARGRRRPLGPQDGRGEVAARARGAPAPNRPPRLCSPPCSRPVPPGTWRAPRPARRP